MADGIKLTSTTNVPDVRTMLKQINFGTAAGLTKTAKEGQAAAQASAGTKFKFRTPWMMASSPIGVRITPATPGTQFAEVYTKAYFGELQDEGGVKLPFSASHLAIPAKGGPLANMRRIPDELKPRALIESGKGFIIITDKGTPVIATHNLAEKGRFAGTVIMYILVKKANIKATAWFYKPIQKVVDERLLANVNQAIDEALRTARP